MLILIHQFDSSINGATYVPVNVAIKFEQTLQKHIQSVTVIDDNRANDEQEYNLHFKKSWLLCLYPCLSTDNYGIMFVTIPRFHLSRNYFLRQQALQNLWKVVSILVSIQEIWDLINDIQFQRSQWHGCCYIILVKKCFLQWLHILQKNPFTIIEISKV